MAHITFPVILGTLFIYPTLFLMFLFSVGFFLFVAKWYGTWHHLKASKFPARIDTCFSECRDNTYITKGSMLI